MKNTMKTLAVIFLAIITFSCDNDDPSVPAPNANVCNYQGLTFDDNANNVHTLIPESDLKTQIFNNPPTGIPAVEISTILGSTYPLIEFRTEAITAGATEVITMWVNATAYNNVTVTCQRAGTVVGDEFRFDIVGGGVEAEFCVGVDNVVIYYEDLDFDGFGSQTIATPSSANLSTNSDDCDDTDATINPNATEIMNDNIDSNCNGNDNN